MMRHTLPLLLALSLLLAGCGSMLRGSVPGGTTSPLISDASIRVSAGYNLTIEKIVFSAAGAALMYTIYDPLAPNWVIEEELIAEDTYRLGFTMKRFFIGGEGEVNALLRRWAEAVRQDGRYDDYRIERLEQGIESNTPIARRYAHAVVRMTRRPPQALPAVLVDEVDGQAGTRAVEVSDLSTAAPAGPSPDELAPLPRPLAWGEAAASGADDRASPTKAVDLPRPPPLGVNQVTLNARVLFEFDSARLTAAGRAALDHEVVARRDELGRLALLLISGHTDRIGTYEYNQRLSEARAQTVKSYLQARGFAGNRVASVGYGKTRPLAGFACDETLSRSAQIDCMAPQRRVELEFREAG